MKIVVEFKERCDISRDISRLYGGKALNRMFGYVAVLCLIALNEKLVGDLAGAYSRRINVQHRLVYEVIEPEKIVKVIRMWTHYE